MLGKLHPPVLVRFDYAYSVNLLAPRIMDHTAVFVIGQYDMGMNCFGYYKWGKRGMGGSALALD